MSQLSQMRFEQLDHQKELEAAARDCQMFREILRHFYFRRPIDPQTWNASQFPLGKRHPYRNPRIPWSLIVFYDAVTDRIVVWNEAETWRIEFFHHRFPKLLSPVGRQRNWTAVMTEAIELVSAWGDRRELDQFLVLEKLSRPDG